MATKIDITPEGSILRVRVEGTIKPHLNGGDLGELARVLGVCAEHECEGILFDISCATVVIGTLDMYRVGTALADQMTPGVKIAVYYNPDSTKEDPFFELVTQNRGILYRAFSAESEALRWLNASR